MDFVDGGSGVGVEVHDHQEALVLLLGGVGEGDIQNQVHGLGADLGVVLADPVIKPGRFDVFGHLEDATDREQSDHDH